MASVLRFMSVALWKFGLMGREYGFAEVFKAFLGVKMAVAGVFIA